ncbi:MAG: hypothetical protein D3905_12005, partial [Candidatus Electrothrix sp. AS4_5]|nr:hypothetical protein [Candidatus Electrothrix gigas]
MRPKVMVRNKIIPFSQLLLMLFCAPFLLGQSDCQINQDLMQSLQGLFNQKFQQTSPGAKIYITQLSFMDSDSKSIMVQTEEAALINEAVQDGIERASKLNTSLAFNTAGHTIKNTDANVKQLTQIVYDRNKTPEERIAQIIDDIMEPNGVDVIVTGQYTDRGNSEPILLKPFLIVKKEKKIVTRSLQFDRKEYICS